VLWIATVIEQNLVTYAEVVPQKIAGLRVPVSTATAMRRMPAMSTCLVASNTSPSCLGISDQFIHLIRLMLQCDNTDFGITLDHRRAGKRQTYHVIGISFH
jgi:hypothetical protein